MNAKKLGSIAIVFDDGLPREKRRMLTLLVNSMRQYSDVTLIPGNVTEDELLQRLKLKPADLVLLPWNLYLHWTRLEALHGLSRTYGPTSAGYFCEPLETQWLETPSSFLRSILLDFNTLDAAEIHRVLRALIQDTARSGILPLLRPRPTIHTDAWRRGDTLGAKLDALMTLPELAEHPRLLAIRSAVLALWGLSVDTASDDALRAAVTAKAPHALLQIAITPEAVVLRLCFSRINFGQKDVLDQFRPNPAAPWAPAQALLAAADFVRVHMVAESSDIDLVAVFYPSASAEKTPRSPHTLWIEPIARALVSEIPGEGCLEEVSTAFAHYKPLIPLVAKAGSSSAEDSDPTLEAFATRYFQTSLELVRVEAALESTPPNHRDPLRLQAERLRARQDAWAQTLARMLQDYQKARKRWQAG